MFNDLLIPIHLIYGRDVNADQINSYNNDVLEINGEQMRRNVSTFGNIINHFLKRFMWDYMLALQERHSYQRRKSNNTCILKVNDIALVKSDEKCTAFIILKRESRKINLWRR